MQNNNPKNCLEEDNLLKAVSVLEKGGVVAFPTETYYGLAVDPFNEEALEKLFHIKRRDKNKAVLLLIHEQRQLARLTPVVPGEYQPLMANLWPGALTLIFEAIDGLSSLITGGSGGVGARISSNPIARDFCRLWKAPLTATSANISGDLPAESADEVLNIFGDSVDFVIDGGPSPAGDCSTIICLVDRDLHIKRQGKIPLEAISSLTSCRIHL